MLVSYTVRPTHLTELLFLPDVYGLTTMSFYVQALSHAGGGQPFDSLRAVSLSNRGEVPFDVER